MYLSWLLDLYAKHAFSQLDQTEAFRLQGGF